ncbi:MAG: serine hydrolase, partial [Acidobacteria bacterium]|nr:serine hydrolase [Acidobacteriota bacterium]
MRRIRIGGACAGWLALACAAGCGSGDAGPIPGSGADGGAAATRAELDRGARRWVETTLAGLDLEEKAAQMVLVRAYGLPQNPDSDGYRRLASEVESLGVGGLVLFRSELDTVPALLDDLQRRARVPLLVSADLERSLAFRFDSGTVPLPSAMAIGATRSTEAARFAGEVTAREARAVGIQWILGPVADVNNNPENPIINVRSFGEDPTLVGELASAYIEGAHAGHALTTAKHFPGHGDTAVDSHLELPRIEGDRARLDRVELAPFRQAIAAGVDSLMIGHLEVPALDPSGRPATLSPIITTELLRGELGFRGLVATDALEMKGVGGSWIGQAAVEAVQAGADVLMLPEDPRVAIQSVARAVREGLIDEARLDASVERILVAKARLGLHLRRTVDPEAARRAVGRPEDVARSEEIARQSVTLVRDRGDLLPLRIEAPLRILHLVLSSDWTNVAISGIPERELAARGIAVETRRFGPQLAESSAREILAAAPDFTHVLVSAFVRVTSSKGTAALDPTHAALLERLASAGVPLVVVSFGNPYLLGQFPDVGTYLCAFGWEDSSQRAAVAALLGESAIGGKLPVTLPGLHAYGEGLERAERRLEIAPGDPATVGFSAEGLAEVDRLIEGYVESRAFPGAVVAIGRRGVLAHLAAFGRLSDDADAAPTRVDTIYDLASLTKVVATTTATMMMVDEGRLDLDAPVQSFLPRFVGPGKEAVTVRHLLTHSSGIDWWAPLYQELRGKEAFLDRIYSMPLVYPPGTETKYSDLGVMLLGEILERVSGQPLPELLKQRLFEPLGMTDTGWLPSPELLSRIAPTENDPWRGRVVRGEVHDENA